ncbi:hypothetical protein LCGC14_1313960 [marine sediment metagenome]|uniref:Uncharacterized protein n=1 Tax=marine sediment metagenome TaxID=412755 RepID=A0A0F9L6M7_9ZZZZ
MIPSPRDIQKDEAKFISGERVNRKKCPICFSSLKEEYNLNIGQTEFHCSFCKLNFNQTYLNVFWFGFEVGVDATVTHPNMKHVLEGESDE